MSPITTKVINQSKGFPRVSGDEPQFMEAEEYIRTFSPRERG